MQRLFLATRWRGRQEAALVGGVLQPPADAQAVAAALAAEAAALGFDATKAAVGADLRDQVLGAARVMHGVFGGVHRRPGGVGSPTLAASFASAHGHALAARSSAIPGAGHGVFLEGAADLPPGSLVAFYPGAAYPPLSHRALPGYPQVDRGGSFLMARFDGVILDAAAWGRGSTDCAAPLRDRGGGGGPAIVPGPAAAAAEAALARGCDPRNPLALGHLANHPPPGGAPNVMAAAVDVGRVAEEVLGREPWLRPYLPVAVCGEERAEEGEAGGDHHKRVLATTTTTTTTTTTPLPLLVLVATRPLTPGTEILLNYRLSPHLAKPDWYAAVDEDEDARRWA